MYLGNVMLVLLNIFFIPAFASVARVPYRVLVPAIVVICMLGTYTVNGSILETWIMLACGVVVFFMKPFGFSPAATVIALVLGHRTPHPRPANARDAFSDPVLATLAAHASLMSL